MEQSTNCKMKFLLFIVFTGLVGESLAVEGMEILVKCQDTVCRGLYINMIRKIIGGGDATDAQKAYDKCMHACRLGLELDGFPVEPKLETKKDYVKCQEIVCKDFYETLIQKIRANEDVTDARKAYDKCMHACQLGPKLDGFPVEPKLETKKDFAKCHETCKDFYETLLQKIVANEDATDARKAYDKCMHACQLGPKLDGFPVEPKLETKKGYVKCQEIVCKDFYETLLQKIVANEDATDAQKAYDKCLYECRFGQESDEFPVEPKLDIKEDYVKCQEIVCKDLYETLFQKILANEDATDAQKGYDKCLDECQYGQEIDGFPVEQKIETKESYVKCQEIECKGLYENLLEKILANEDAMDAQKAYDNCIYGCRYGQKID